MSAQEAQAVLVALLDATQALVAGEWENHDSPSPVECTLDETSGVGVAFTGRRTLDVGGSLDPVVAAVSELWRSAGLEVGRSTIGNFDTLLGVDPHNRAFFAELQLGARTGVVRGQSPCVPGNAWDELQRVKQQAGATA